MSRRAYVEETVVEKIKEESINDYRDLFLSLVKENPSLEDALDQLYNSINLGNIEKQRNKVIKKCQKILEQNFEKIIKMHPNVTKDESLIICTYTYEDEYKAKLSPYKILNSNLVSNDRKNGIKNISKYFYILLKSLRNLTPFNPENKIIYRALGQKVITEIPRDNPNYIPYKDGNEKTFWAFTSTSLKLTTDFLGQREDLKVGTKFMIHGNIIGYDISPFSQFENEKEILLEPESKFRIEQVCETNGVIDVECYILKTSPVLSDIIKPKTGNEKNIENTETNNININNINTNNDNKINDNKINDNKINDNKINDNKINDNKINDNKINDNKIKKENEIILKIKIEESDLNKNIYFLDNTDGTYREYTSKRNFTDFFKNTENGKFIKHKHDNLSEMNKKTTTLIINEITVPFKKYFIPKNTGIYTIKLLFKKKLSNCSYMFCQCRNIIDIDFSNFNTENVIDMKYMFYKCFSLPALDLSFFNTENVADMQCMFEDCSNIKSLNLKSFKTGKVIYMNSMFGGCSSLISLDLKSFDTQNVINMICMFFECSSLEKLDLSSFNTENVKDMKCIFYGCSKLDPLYLTSFNDENNEITMNYKINKEKKNIKVLSKEFVKNNNRKCKFIINKKVYDICEYIDYNKYNINKNDDLLKIILVEIKTEKITDLSFMYHECDSLISLELESFNTQNITNMKYMFCSCSKLTSLVLKSFNTENVTDMQYMFCRCSGLISLDLKSFNTINVIAMNSMFNSCFSLKNIDLSSFKTENVIDMSIMFFKCESLTILDLSSFITENVTNMEEMFSGCNSLNEINLSSFKADKANVKSMFTKCNKLSIYQISDLKIKDEFDKNKK